MSSPLSIFAGRGDHGLSHATRVCWRKEIPTAADRSSRKRKKLPPAHNARGILRLPLTARMMTGHGCHGGWQVVGLASDFCCDLCCGWLQQFRNSNSRSCSHHLHMALKLPYLVAHTARRVLGHHAALGKLPFGCRRQAFPPLCSSLRRDSSNSSNRVGQPGASRQSSLHSTAVAQSSALHPNIGKVGHPRRYSDDVLFPSANIFTRITATRHNPMTLCRPGILHDTARLPSFARSDMFPALHTTRSFRRILS